MYKLMLLVMLVAPRGAAADALTPLDFRQCPSPVLRTPTEEVDGVGTSTNQHPYDVVMSPDGKWLFVSYMQPPSTGEYIGGIQVFANDWGTLTETMQSAHRDAALTIGHRQVSGLELAPDGHTLLAAAHDSVMIGGNPATQESDLLVLDVSDPTSVKLVRDVPIQPGTGPGSIEVRTDGKLVWVANEYNDTISTIDLSTGVVLSNTHLATLPVWSRGGGHHPVGMAVDATNHRLYVATEDLIGGTNNVGSVIMLDVTTNTPAYKGARNGGCAPARLKLDGHGHLFVAARGSDAIYAFHTGDIWGNQTNAGLVGFARTGRKPLGMEFADGGNMLLVANSNRDTGVDGSMASFYVHDILTTNGAEAALWYSSGGGEFSRQIAVQGVFVFMTNFDSASVQFYLVP